MTRGSSLPLVSSGDIRPVAFAIRVFLGLALPVYGRIPFNVSHEDSLFAHVTEKYEEVRALERISRLPSNGDFAILTNVGQVYANETYIWTRRLVGIGFRGRLA